MPTWGGVAYVCFIIDAYSREVTDPNYPFAGGTSVEFAEIHTHPDYNDAAFVLHDVGLVILAQPVTGVQYGRLTDVGKLDELAVRRGLQSQQFTPVGYGLQSVVPDMRADLVRYRATVGLIDMRGTAGIPARTSVMFTNNPGQRNTGGTCFGDSGGPVFVGGTLESVAVTSFGLNQNCVGVGGGYRVDTTDAQSFINRFLQASNG